MFQVTDELTDEQVDVTIALSRHFSNGLIIHQFIRRHNMARVNARLLYNAH